MKTIQENCLETFRALSRRIRNAETLEELHALDTKVDKFYGAGCLTVNQYGRLTVQVMDALARREGV